MTTPRLRIINSDLSGREFPLPEGTPVVIGRARGVDILIPDPSVSRRHVQAEVRGGRCVLTDLGSHNGIVVGDQSFRELTLTTGSRFELGDVAIEFTCPDAAPVAQPPAPPKAAARVPAAPMAPGERPVFLDDLFGPGVTPLDAQAVQEEKAVIKGARSNATYALVIIAILVLGAIAWHVAGSPSAQRDIKPVLVKVGEQTVVDLGLRNRESGGQIEPYINFRETYANAHGGDKDIAIVEIDSGFMAIIEGIDLGSTDYELIGKDGRRATLRILVRGAVPRPKDEDMTTAERIRRGKGLIAGGQSAQQTGDLYEAVRQFEQAHAVLNPVRTSEGIALDRLASRSYDAARAEWDTQFQEIKDQAKLGFKSHDDRAAAKAIRELLSLVPDETDVMHQKLRIIYNRTLHRLWKKGL